MLAVLFSVNSQRHGLDSAVVEGIVPSVPLRPEPGAPAAMAGIFSYRGQAVPVIDLSYLAGGKYASSFLSTRIILVKAAHLEGGTRLLGLLAECVNEVRQISSRDAVRVVTLPELLPVDLLAQLPGASPAANLSP